MATEGGRHNNGNIFGVSCRGREVNSKVYYEKAGYYCVERLVWEHLWVLVVCVGDWESNAEPGGGIGGGGARRCD